MSQAPENYRSCVNAYNRDDETMLETLNRLIHAPDPDVPAAVLAAAEVEEARAATEQFDTRDTERWSRARTQFET